MSRKERQEPEKLETNMSAMIDIVFLLIIFFMTVSQITYVNDEPLELPQLAGTDDQETSTFTINITSEGSIVISGRTVSLSETLLFVGQELSARGGDPSQVKIMIRCDHRRSSDLVNELVRKLSELGIRQIRVGVQVSS